MRKAITQRRTNCRARCFRETGLRNDLNSGSASCMISTGGSFFSGWRMVRFLTTILPKSAERRKPPPFEPTHVEKAQLQNSRRWRQYAKLAGNKHTRRIVGSLKPFRWNPAGDRSRPVEPDQQPEASLAWWVGDHPCEA